VGKSSNTATPDLIIAFNAGVWGYDSWKPTMERLVGLQKSIPFVVTAYTLQEAEDDYETIKDIADGMMGDEASRQCLLL